MEHTGLSNRITQGSIWKALLLFFFPVLLGSLFQQLYNTVDAVIVGRFVGKEALAAVGGSAANILSLIVGFFIGVSSGAAVVVSQHYGADEGEDVSRSVHTALVLAAAGGAGLTVLGLLTAPWLLEAMHTPEETMTDALRYIRVIYLGMVPSMVYNMGSAILQAVGDSKRPLYFLIICCFVNILLDLLFVLGLGLGVTGAAAATIIAQTVSAVLVCRHLARSNDSYALKLNKLRAEPGIVRRTVRIGLPAGLQAVMYGLSNLIITAAVNTLGTDSVAAWVAMGKIDTLNWVTISALGVSLMTFSGQNYGAKRLDRVRSSFRWAMLMGLVMCLGVSALLFFGGRYMLLLFTNDAHVLEIALLILVCMAPFYALYVPVELLGGGLRGLGDTLVPTVITAVGICVFRLLWVFAVLPFWPGILSLSLSYPISWALTSLAFIVYYFKKWKQRLRGES